MCKLAASDCTLYVHVHAQFNPRWLPVFHSSLKKIPKPFLMYMYMYMNNYVQMYMETGICAIPYSGYFSGGKIFMGSEFFASSWKNFRGFGILNHTLVLCGTLSWVKISWFASQPQKPQKILPPPKNTRYAVCNSCPIGKKA